MLYPHFQKTIIPGWLDKGLRHRHRATARLDNVVVLAPSAQWVATLPGAKLPDRNDFKHFGDDLAARVAAWSRAVRESERLRDEFADWVDGGRHRDPPAGLGPDAGLQSAPRLHEQERERRPGYDTANFHPHFEVC